MPRITPNQRDDFSQTLLTSIPVKVTAWLQNLDLLDKQKGTLGSLSWRIRNNQGKSFIKVGEIEITWQGPFGDIRGVEINHTWAENIAHNMPQFVALEKRIYDEIQKFEDELLEKLSHKVTVPARVQLEVQPDDNGIL